MRLFAAVLALFCTLTATAQWTVLPTGISDNLNDIHFRNENTGLAAGSHGIYYTLTGGNGASAWTRFSPGDAGDNALYNRCKFLKIAPDPASFKNYICGYDTVNKKAVLFYFKTDDQTYSFVYTGPANSALYGIDNYLGDIYAVGTDGLVLHYRPSNGQLATYPPITSKTLRSVNASGTSLLIGGDSILLKGLATNTDLFSQTIVPINYSIHSIILSGQTVYLAGPSGYYKTTTADFANVSEITSYKNGPLHATRMYLSSPQNRVFVSTDHGVYEQFGDPLEFQPASTGYVLNSFSMPYGNTLAYACGNNGLVIKSTNTGGGTIPYLNANLITGCRGDNITINREPGGSCANSHLIIYNSSGTQVVDYNTSCAYSAGLGTSTLQAGNYTIRYIMSNNSFADTATYSVLIPDPPATNLTSSLDRNMLCKSGQVLVSVGGTSAGWDYSLVNADGTQSYGSGAGNGGSISFQSTAISNTGAYHIRVSAQNSGCKRDFTNTLPITVEKTKSKLVSRYINGFVNEPVTFNATSNDAQFYKWTFDNSASQSIVNGRTVKVSFNSVGAKNVELISWSANGCYDTATLKATTVVSEAALPTQCYNYNVDDTDPQYDPQNVLSRDMKLVGDGILISGGGNRYTMKSGAGDTVARTDYGGLYLAKYSKKGTLRWRIYSKYYHYDCAACSYPPTPAVWGLNPLPDGSIVWAGNDHGFVWTYLNNGDSVQLTGPTTDTDDNLNFRGFVTQIDSMGRMLWRGVFYGAVVRRMRQDRAGNIWLSVNVNNQSYYNKNGVISTLLIANAGASDITNMLVKLSPTGDFIFAAGTSTKGITDLMPDNNGDVWITGTYHGTIVESSKLYNGNGNVAVALPPATGTFTSDAMFLAKYSSNGTYQYYMVSQGFSNNNMMRPDQLALDSLNNIYITGKASAANSADTVHLLQSNGVYKNINFGGFFLLKYNSSGVFQWANGSRYNSYESLGHSIGTTSNSVYLTSEIWPINFTPWAGSLTSAGGNSYAMPSMTPAAFLVAEYDYNGELLKTAQSGTPAGGYLEPNTIIKENGNYYISGETDRNNGGPSLYTMFNQSLPSNGYDAFFTVLSPSFCYSTTTPTANAGPDQSVCSGARAQIGTAASGNLYSWTSNPAGFTSSDPNPFINPHVNTTYYLNVINNSGIMARDTVVVTINGPVADAGADQQVCNGTSATLNPLIVPGATYSWTSSPAGFSSTQANPVVAPSVTTTYFLEVSNGGSCVGRDTVIVRIGTATASAGPDRAICNSGSVQIGAAPVAGYTYAWSPLTGLSSGIDSQPYANPTSTTSYILTATNSDGCQAKDTVVVNVNSLPLATITASGPLIFCQGGNVVLTSSAASGNQWFKGGVAITGATGTTYTTASGGQYAVQYHQNSCFSGLSDIANVNVLPVPAKPTIAMVGDSVFCAGDSVKFFSSALSNNQWYKDGGAIGGATERSYVARLAGIYTVHTSIGDCPSQDADPIRVRINTLPPVPAITALLNVLTSSAPAGNQWYKDGTLIPGATDQTYTAVSLGAYTVKVTLNNCGSVTSAPFSFVTTAINSPALDARLLIAPNPVRDRLVISYSGNAVRMSILLLDMNGRQLASYTLTGNSYSVDMSRYASGMYLVRVVNERSHEQVQRVIVKQ